MAYWRLKRARFVSVLMMPPGPPMPKMTELGPRANVSRSVL
jgi:hypothetical protein